MDEKTRLLQRDILHEGERDKRDQRSKVSLENENEFLKSEIRETDARLLERRQKVEASKTQLRRLDETKMTLSIKIELLEKELTDRRDQAEVRKKAMESELADRKEKVQTLKATAEELEEEIKALDKHLEGSLQVTQT